MAQSIYYMNEPSQYGSIGLEMGVFESIANSILAETSGVIIDTNVLKGSRDAVVAWLEDHKLIVTINIKFKYGTLVSKTSKEIQDKVNTAIKELTNVDPESVNVNIIGIDFN